MRSVSILSAIACILMPSRLKPRSAKRKSGNHQARREGERSSKQNRRKTFPIVAIGASAGGLEAFSNLLRSLPAEPGIALVFIPHLDPTHESAMVELLSRITRLPVLQPKAGLKVE